MKKVCFNRFSPTVVNIKILIRNLKIYSDYMKINKRKIFNPLLYEITQQSN